MKFEVGDKVIGMAKSLHAGHKGTVVADNGYYIMVSADDQQYTKAHKSSTVKDKVFQIARELCKKVK
jgi:hypothetical protein